MTNPRSNDPQSSAILRDRYTIYPEQPLPEFSTGTAQAFGASDNRPAGPALMALIVDPGIPCRIDALRILKGIETPGMMSLIDFGAVYWPPYGSKAMAIVYERPLGGKVMAAFNSEFTPIDGSELIKKVVTPVTSALRQLARHKLTHRAVRPTNMYWATPERKSVVLGDCAAVPAGFDQPVAIETIESAMTHPAGRGNGSAAEDLYALGASVLVLLSGRNVIDGIPSQDIIRSKIIEGSYQTLARIDRVPIHLIEMIKGLLNDDPKARWDQTALDDWITGKRRPPIQSRIEKRAARGFEFGNAEYFSTRELAIAFCTNWESSLLFIADGRLEQWVRRSLGIEDMADAIARTVSERSNGATDRRIVDDLMICQTCMILDNLAPIRFRTVSVMPDGIGALLALTIANGTDVNTLLKVFRREVQKAWADTHELSEEGRDLDTKLRQAYEHLIKPTMGNGIERALYSLNESVPCQSPFINKDFVVDIRDLLPAMDAAAKKADRKAWPVDRHVAAFAGARATFDVERQMTETADSSPERSMLGMLNLLATLQWRLGPKELSALGGVVCGLIKPVINGYHSQQRRKDIERELQGFAGQGDLIAMFRLLDSPEERAKDRAGYQEAGAEWHRMAGEIEGIDKELRNHGDKAADIACRISAVVSMSLALAIILALAVWKH